MSRLGTSSALYLSGRATRSSTTRICQSTNLCLVRSAWNSIRVWTDTRRSLVRKIDFNTEVWKAVDKAEYNRVSSSIEGYLNVSLEQSHQPSRMRTNNRAASRAKTHAFDTFVLTQR
jgi:transposase-like protein